MTSCCCCVHSVQRKGTRRASSLEVETLLSPALFCSISKNLKGGNDTEHLFSYFIEFGELTKKTLQFTLQWKCFIADTYCMYNLFDGRSSAHFLTWFSGLSLKYKVYTNKVSWWPHALLHFVKSPCLNSINPFSTLF